MSDYLTRCRICDLIIDYRAEHHHCPLFIFPDHLDMITAFPEALLSDDTKTVKLDKEEK